MWLDAIAHIESCFPEKFGTPCQPGMVPSAYARLRLLSPFNDRHALRGLEGYSHVWLLFGFHLNGRRCCQPTVRPPRLGGNQRMGVFATRSPFRPNPLGLSVVKLRGIFADSNGCGLLLANHDLVDDTPIYDIKPYLPYSDNLPDAASAAGFTAAPERLSVHFSEQAELTLAQAPDTLRELIVETLSLDPRPAYRREERQRVHGVTLAGHNIRWHVTAQGLVVTAVVAVC